MSIIKLAGQTAGALKQVFKAIKSDVNSTTGSIRKSITGARVGMKQGDIASSYLNQLNKNRKMGNRITNLRNQIQSASKESLHSQKEQAEYAAKQHNKFKSHAKNIIKKHKLREKIIGGAGIAGIGAAGIAGYKVKRDK